MACGMRPTEHTTRQDLSLRKQSSATHAHPALITYENCINQLSQCSECPCISTLLRRLQCTPAPCRAASTALVHARNPIRTPWCPGSSWPCCSSALSSQHTREKDEHPAQVARQSRIAQNTPQPRTLTRSLHRHVAPHVATAPKNVPTTQQRAPSRSRSATAARGAGAARAPVTRARTARGRARRRAAASASWCSPSRCGGGTGPSGPTPAAPAAALTQLPPHTGCSSLGRVGVPLTTDTRGCS
jgi:hypothetical protein